MMDGQSGLLHYALYFFCIFEPFTYVYFLLIRSPMHVLLAPGYPGWLFPPNGCSRTQASSILWLLCHLVVSRSSWSHPNSRLGKEKENSIATTSHLVLKMSCIPAVHIALARTSHMTNKGCWEM